MACQGVPLDQDQFCCPICLDLLKEPVTIPCGHRYCASCIEGCWDLDDLKGVYSCPQCEQQGLLLGKNNMLAEVVKKLKETGLQPTPLDQCYAGPEDVACDFCTGTDGRHQKALKSCLTCLASFCETHLQPHYDVAPLKKHTLVEASTPLQEKICSHHGEVLKVFCHTDQQCICLMCVMDKHKGHNTVSVAAGRTEIQRRLGMSQKRVWQRIQEREKNLNELQQIVESLATAVENSDRIFTELIRSIEKRRSEAKQLLRAQQRAAVSQAEGLLEQLKQEIAELRRRDVELEQLSHTEDHIHFLQNYHALSSPVVSLDLPSIADRALLCTDMCEAVSNLKDKLEDFLKEELPKISNSVSPPEPKTRTTFLKYSCQLTLDPNTAKTQLSLSEGNRKVTFTREVQPYPYHPERFTDRCQVLCRDSLSGCCYWEVEWRMYGVYIAVSYKDISRTGSGISQFGHNDKSWCLQCCPSGYYVRHNDVKTKVSGPHSFRIGVYLDHKAGVLSFYSVISDTMTLLHTFQTTFTQPLYPGFWLSTYRESAELCELK